MTADGARSAGVITATQLMKVLLAAASLLVLSRLLGPTEFGLYAMIIAVLGFGEIFRDLGLSLAATQASSLSPGQRTNLFWVNCGVGLALTALACAASPLIAQFYGRPGITLPMCAAASTFAFNGAAAQIRVDLVRAGRFGAIGVSEVLSQAVGLLTAIGLIVFAHLSLWALIAQPVLQALLVFVFMARAARWRFALPRRGVPIKEFVSFGSTLLLVQLVSYGSSNLDKVLIGRFFGATTLGYYSRAYVLFQQPMQQALAPFTGLAVSRLSLTRDDPARRLGQLLRVQELVNWVGLLGYAFMLGTSGALLEVLLGPQWAGAVPYFQILCIGGCFQILGVPYLWMFLSSGSLQIYLRCALVSQPIAIVLIAVGALGGPTGIAWAVAAGFAVEWLLPATWGASRSVGAARRMLRRTIAPAAVAVVVAVVGLLAGATVPAPPVLGLLVSLLACGAATAVAAAVPRVRRELGGVVRFGVAAAHLDRFLPAARSSVD